MAKIQRVVSGQAPTLMQAEKANEIIDLINGILSSKGGSGIDLTVEGNGRIVVSASNDTSTGIEDYEEKNITICENGEPVNYTFLVKPTEEAATE